MTGFAAVTMLTGIIFLAMILNLAMKKENSAKVTGLFITVSAISGLFIYSYGYSIAYPGNIPLAVVRALMAVWGMFVSKNDFSVVSGTPLFSYSGAVLLFWIVHVMAQYATASTVIATIGARVLRRIRLWTACFGKLVVIYGINEDSVFFARQLADREKTNVVFVDEKQPDSLAAAINSLGGVVVSDKNALVPDKAFLRSIGIRKGTKSVDFYLLDSNSKKNIKYAFALKDALQTAEIPPQATNLVMLGEENLYSRPLQAFKNSYGFGNVTVFNRADLVSRLLIRCFPPAATMEFNPDCTAKENFESVIIGFGSIGRAVMQQLVMNGQFAGSDFSLAVFAPDMEDTGGYVTATSRTVTDNYNISFYNYDGRSHKMYDYILSHKDGMNYIVVCTGDEKTNSKIGGEITRYLSVIGSRAQVYLADYSGITCLTDGNMPPETYPVYSADVLCTGRLDAMAALLNHSYCNNSLTVQENWAECDWFSRMSNRASADFMPSLAISAGKKLDDRQWNLTDTQLDNLGKTEHMRWMAFHYVMGFEKMPEDVYRQREEQYIREKELYGNGRIRIGKDMSARQHACLIPWEELDALSDRENAVTGGSVDYRLMDKANVLAIPKLYAVQE